MTDKKSASTTEKKSASTTEKKERKARTPVEYKDNADRFKQLGTKRVNKAVKQLKLIGNLAGSGYEYTEQQVEVIRSSLQAALDSAMARFEQKQSENRSVEL